MKASVALVVWLFVLATILLCLSIGSVVAFGICLDTGADKAVFVSILATVISLALLASLTSLVHEG